MLFLCEAMSFTEAMTWYNCSFAGRMFFVSVCFCFNLVCLFVFVGFLVCSFIFLKCLMNKKISQEPEVK